MTQYEHALVAMERLLQSVGETHWAQWIGIDIERWRLDRDTSHHLSAYGGMGSFNDVVICLANNHHVTEVTEAWVNALFEWLKSLCHFLAKHPTDSFLSETLAHRIGRHDSSLAAFVDGEDAPASMRGYAIDPPVLQGWRCLRCGQAEVSARDIEYLMAHDLIPNLVFAACESDGLDRLVDRVLSADALEVEGTRDTLRKAVTASGILLTNRDGWNWKCPHCGSDDTAVYRWKLRKHDGIQLEPSSDNLPLR
jgi:hypothetical protein